MTLRLVALMSVVLLLSLAAFGVLMSHHQDQVMQELTQTVSDVGRAALGTFEFDWHGEGNAQVWVYDDDPSGLAHERHVERTIVAHAHSPGEAPKTIKRIERYVTTTDGEGAVPDGNPFFIDLEEIRAESDPSQNRVVLTIPRLTPADGPEGHATHGSLEQVEVLVKAFEKEEGGPPVRAMREEISLPIPIEEFDDLFARTRGRSLFLFLGVFLVGTVLSTGMAARFTRPIRKLDAGIRRLADGDLDVEVAVQGKDEIARLSRAFNTMAAKLRIGRERSRELARREKLSALGRLAAGVAHDVRNPLHSIGLTLQHIDETSRPRAADRSAEFDRSLEIIRSEIRRLDELVGNFLRFAKSERHEREPVDLAGLIRETAKLVRKEAEWRRVELELELDPATPPVLADVETLRSAILNLVLNGFEAMPEGGKLHVRLSAANDEVRLEVEDNGIGIPEADRDRVFDFAYTTKDGGSGLGLAMVQHCVVEEHGGKVVLDSTPDRGTRVRLAFPVMTEEAEAAS